MYLNVISFKNSKTLAFQSTTPYSVDKVAPEWNIVTDELNGQVLSFRGSEVVTIASAPVSEQIKDDLIVNKKAKITTKVITK